MTSKHTTAFVIAGGGSLGAVQVGMLKALAAAGVQADLVAGVSVGSINAFCYACDPTREGVERLERLWLSIGRDDIFPAPGLRGLWRMARRGSHLYDPGPLARMLSARLPAAEFESTRLPCHVVATDVLAGTAVTLSRGPILPALLASTAIPALFPPVEIDARLLSDGGFAYQAPFESVVAAGATRLYVLPTGYSCARTEPPGSALEHALNALNHLTVSKLIGSIQHYSRALDVRIVPPLCPMTVSPLDFSRTAELIERAEAQTRDWLVQDGGSQGDATPQPISTQLVPSQLIPPQLVPHRH